MLVEKMQNTILMIIMIMETMGVPMETTEVIMETMEVIMEVTMGVMIVTFPLHPHGTVFIMILEMAEEDEMESRNQIDQPGQVVVLMRNLEIPQVRPN
jgi:hypothetical protein